MILAEDDRALREGLERFIKLRVTDVDIETVEDGKPLVARVREGGYSLVLTDNQMTYVDGLEAIRQIREFDQQVPIYMLSGSYIKEQALEAGATGYVNKSKVMQELPPVLTQHL